MEIQNMDIRHHLTFCIALSLFAFWGGLTAQAASDLDAPDMSLAELLDLDVTVATKSFKVAANEAPSVVSVILRKEIQQMGARTMEDVLRNVAGFDVITWATTSYPTFGIRGFSNNSNEILHLLVNGHPFATPYRGISLELGAFPVDLIERIEIIRGPGSALYGNNAMVGVVNIITLDDTADTFVSGGYGSFDLYRGTAHYANRFGNFGIQLFVDRFFGDGDPNRVESDYATYQFGPIADFLGMDPEEVGNAPGYTYEGIDRTSLFARLRYKNGYITGMHIYDGSEDPLSDNRTITEDNWNHITSGFIEMGYEGDLFRSTHLTVRSYYDQFHFDSYIVGFSPKTTQLLNRLLQAGYPEGVSADGKFTIQNQKIGCEVTLAQELVHGSHLLVGIQYEYLRQHGSEFTANVSQTGETIQLFGSPYPFMHYLGRMVDLWPYYPFTRNEDRHVYALYGQWTMNLVEVLDLYKIGETLSFTMGLRLDEYTDVGSTLNPRTGLVYAPNNSLYFKLLYGTAFRAPNFRELYNRNNAILNGNTELEPETLETFEGVFGWNLAEWLTTSLTVFQTGIENLVSMTEDPETTAYININKGKVETAGLEWEMRLQQGLNKYGYFNMTYRKTQDVTHETIVDAGGFRHTMPDFDVGNVPEVIINLGANIDLSRHINLHAALNYKGKRKRSGRMRFTPSPTDPDGTLEQVDARKPLGGQTIVNAALTLGDFDFAKGLKLQLSGFNLLNTDDRSPEPQGSVLNDIPRWGRSFLFKAAYSF